MEFLNEKGRPSKQARFTFLVLFMTPFILVTILNFKEIPDNPSVFYPYILLYFWVTAVCLVLLLTRKAIEKWKKE
jgi:hypothetical protein